MEIELEQDQRDWEVSNFSKKEFNQKTNDFALIIITWNEGDRLKKLLDDCQSYLNLIDVIIVDGGSEDGSTDDSYLEIKKITTLLTCHEPGLGCAIRVGLAYALQENYKGLVTIDSNGKDDLSSIVDIIEKLEEDYDLVQASRFMKGGYHKNTPLFRMIGIHTVIIPALALGGGFWFTDPTNGFKGLSRRYLLDPRVQPLRNIFKKFNMQYYLNYRAARLGLKVLEIPASRVYPDSGQVPTKISGFVSHLQIIIETIKTALGCYNPSK